MLPRLRRLTPLVLTYSNPRSENSPNYNRCQAPEVSAALPGEIVSPQAKPANSNWIKPLIFSGLLRRRGKPKPKRFSPLFSRRYRRKSDRSSARWMSRPFCPIADSQNCGLLVFGPDAGHPAPEWRAGAACGCGEAEEVAVSKLECALPPAGCPTERHSPLVAAGARAVSRNSGSVAPFLQGLGD